ncbi:MAG: hypothetical protein LBC31_03760 [Treponema sp.]|jgi:PTS system glucitol/sorbitol-specific IIC component|nr:hypothetical protein [Treponema sp.]
MKQLGFWRSLAAGIFTVTVVMLVIFKTGLGDRMSGFLEAKLPFSLGILLIGLICCIPLISPVIGPGLLIAVVTGVLVFEQIASGNLKVIMVLPSLLAIDAQVGGGFIQPGLAMGESEKATINVGVPPVLFTRLITVPIALVIACIFCFNF